MPYCPRTWCDAHRSGAQHSTNCPEFTTELPIGTRVSDVNVVRHYGIDSALIGTVTRVYDNPVGMAEVRWDATDIEESSTEDVWLDELVAR